MFGRTPASNAVDGNTNNKFSGGSVANTYIEQNPWWQVDLGDTYSISRVVVFPFYRDDYLKDYTVTLLLKQGNQFVPQTTTEVFPYYGGETARAYDWWPPQDLVRIVRIDTKASTKFTLRVAEVQVYSSNSTYVRLRGVMLGA